MTPYYADDHLTLYGGDCRAVLASMPERSVHCVVTSPPYWGLRDYGVADQLGLEATPEEYVANMVAVFREVRRVLRDDGTLWLNLGDSYAGGKTGRTDSESLSEWIVPGTGRRAGGLADKHGGEGRQRPVPVGMKPKDLVGIPWRVAFALQADGWYLRSDIIWSKPNPMPESVTDRPTKAHEYLFLLSKSPRYYYDADAVREGDAGLPSGNGFAGRQGGARQSAVDGGTGTLERFTPGAGRNLRSVWTIATEPYPGAHFATFPRKLVEPCVKAGTSERGVCPECGAPWVRVVEVLRPDRIARDLGEKLSVAGDEVRASASARMGRGAGWRKEPQPSASTTGWRPTCAHTAEPVPAAVLDPFAGSGTTLLVAQALGRKAVGIDLNPDYLAQAMHRNRQTPLGLVG